MNSYVSKHWSTSFWIILSHKHVALTMPTITSVSSRALPFPDDQYRTDQTSAFLLFDISKTNYRKICAQHSHDKNILFSLLSPGVIARSPYFSSRILSNNEVLESCRQHSTRLRLWIHHYQTTEPLNTPEPHLILVLLLYLLDSKDSFLIRI